MTDKAKAFFDACAEGRHLEVQEALREASDAQTHTLLDQDVPFKPVGYNRELKLKPLHVAAYWGRGEVVKLLVDGGANLDAQDEDGDTALHSAAGWGHGEVVKLLVDGGANLEAQKGRQTALHRAAGGGHGEVVKLLMDKGANLDAQDEDGRTALIVAAYWGRGEVVKLLVDGGANLDAQEDNDGQTALHLAAWEGHGEVVKLLVDGGANLDIQDKDGKTARQCASEGENASVCFWTMFAALMSDSKTDSKTEIEYYRTVLELYQMDYFDLGKKYLLMVGSSIDEGLQASKNLLVLFLVLIDSKNISDFKFTDAEFSKLSKGFADSLQLTVVSERISKPLGILSLLAGALSNRARRRTQVQGDLLALRSKVVQLALAALGIPEMDEEYAALKAMGYSKKHIDSGEFVTMARFSSSDHALDAPIHFLVTQGVAEIVAAPQIQSSLEKVYYRNRTAAILSNENDDPLQGPFHDWKFQDWRALPRFYFLSQAVFHCFYLGVTVLAISTSNKLSWSSGVLICMSIGYSVEEIHQSLRHGVSRYVNDPWNLLDLAFLLFSYIWLITGKTVWLAVNLFVLPFRLLHYLSIFESSGILVAVLFRMIAATANFLIFFIVILVGFSGMLTIIYGEKDEFESLPVSCLTLFDASLGNYDFTIFMGDDNEDNDWLGIGFLICFLLLSTVMILNLLIAVLSEEYSQVSECSYQNWCLMNAEIIQENTITGSKFPDNLRLPPPLSLLSHLAFFLLWFGEHVVKKISASNNYIVEIRNPLDERVDQPAPGAKDDVSLIRWIAISITIIRWIAISIISIADVTVHLIVGLPWALVSVYISSFHAICKGWYNDDTPIWARILWVLFGIPVFTIVSFLWWTPASSFIAWKQSVKTENEKQDEGHQENDWLESMKNAISSCAITEDGNDSSQVLGEVSKVKAEVLGEVSKVKAEVEAQVGELKAQVEAQGGKLEAMMARLLEAQGLATPTPAMEESVTKEEGDGTGGLAPAGVDETKSSS